MDERNPFDENITDKTASLSEEEPRDNTSENDSLQKEEAAPDINSAVMPDPKDYGWHPAMPGNYPPNMPNGQYYNQQPGYYPYNAPQYYKNNVPKKKMKAGAKAFFIIVGTLFALLIITTSTYAVHRIVNYIPESPSFPFFPGGDTDKTPSNPDKNESSAGANDLEQVERPAITPNTDGILLHSLPNSEEKTAKEIYASIKNSIVGVVVTSNGEVVSQGSGIIATADGYIITNAHVVLNKRNVNAKIVMNNETEYSVAVVGFDKTTDLAVLKVYDTNDTFTPVEFGNSDELSVGEWVLAIGNPGGQDFASSLTRGIVSAVNRKVGSNSSSGMTYIQTDAAINPGNSGGALVNMHGQVIGINSSKIVATGYEGMGFSIPITQAKSIIDELMAAGYVQGRTRLGITGVDVSSAQVALYGVPQGFQIASIDDDGAFAGTQAKVGDIITAMDGETVTGLKDITAFLASHRAGDKVTVTLYRNDSQSGSKTIAVDIILLEDKGETQG